MYGYLPHSDRLSRRQQRLSHEQQRLLLYGMSARVRVLSIA